MGNYTKFEENLNIKTHYFGAVISVLGLVLFLIQAPSRQSLVEIASLVIFSISMITLYTASVCYHNATDPIKRKRLKIFDHCAIYILIAGSYTPYALITLKGTLGLIVFALAWSMATMGVILKLFFTGRFEILSTFTYIFMGWMITFFIGPLKLALPAAGLELLGAGGIAYTLGAIIYSIKQIKLNHAIFHVFVLIGSFCHFLSIYLYV